MEIDYKEFVQKVLKQMPERTRKIMVRRFGLDKKGKGETLEAIGKSYNITRERIRQIERDGFRRVKKIVNSPELKKDFERIESSFEKKLKQFGGVKREKELVSSLGSSQSENQILFLLNLVDNFKRDKGDNHFYAFWYSDSRQASLAKNIASDFVEKFKRNKKAESLDAAFEGLKKEKLTKEAFASYLEISKHIFRSIDGQKIGLVSFSDVNPRTVRDKIVLILNEKKEPLHFREITDMIFSLNKDIEKRSNRSLSLHPQTVHNELIRSNDFILVGRGLYALKDWGYKPGRVKDVIASVLKASVQPLAKEEIINAVLKQRMVKESTIFLGLQDKKLFEKNEEGKYKVREA
ncbi:MAG: sigma factor-like helix-turn-helix DNA-binding protein [Candidatus Pacebacteria bacterium]|nr:sigma factor-like helix-turn-helix DNA-binding protein [Candidatus Paceibacterota bacterium]